MSTYSGTSVDELAVSTPASHADLEPTEGRESSERVDPTLRLNPTHRATGQRTLKRTKGRQLNAAKPSDEPDF